MLANRIVSLFMEKVPTIEADKFKKGALFLKMKPCQKRNSFK